MWLWSAALAAPLVVENGDAIRVTVVVPAPLADVLAVIRDPRQTTALYGRGEFQLVPRADGCFDQRFADDYGIMSVSYLALACPNPAGATTLLVQSDSYSEMAFGWEGRAVADGTEIAYWYRAALNAPIPRWMVRRSVRSASVELVERLAERFAP